MSDGWAAWTGWGEDGRSRVRSGRVKHETVFRRKNARRCVPTKGVYFFLSPVCWTGAKLTVRTFTFPAERNPNVRGLCVGCKSYCEAISPKGNKALCKRTRSVTITPERTRLCNRSLYVNNRILQMHYSSCAFKHYRILNVIECWTFRT